MYCRHCGNKLDGTQEFCPACGNRVNASEAAAGNEGRKEFAGNGSVQKKAKTVPGSKAIAVIAVCAAITVGSVTGFMVSRTDAVQGTKVQAAETTETNTSRKAEAVADTASSAAETVTQAESNTEAGKDEYEERISALEKQIEEKDAFLKDAEEKITGLVESAVQSGVASQAQQAANNAAQPSQPSTVAVINGATNMHPYVPDYTVTYSYSAEVFPYSSQYYLSWNDVCGLSPEVAQAAINEIYARHGYIFKNKSKQAYYESMPGYRPVSGSQDEIRTMFNCYERENVELLTQVR